MNGCEFGDQPGMQHGQSGEQLPRKYPVMCGVYALFCIVTHILGTWRGSLIAY